MLELIAIIFLSKKNGRLAAQKGLKPGLWILYTVLCWFGFEFAGILAGVAVFGKEYLMPIYLLCILLAASSYFFIRSVLNKKPDTMDEDINRIGVKDLYPER